MKKNIEDQQKRDAEHLSDEQLILRWGAARASCAKSLRVMRKEADRFALWARYMLGKHLREISVEDAQAYTTFLSDPQPRDFWISTTKRPRSHPEWRPFAGPLSASSRRLALIQLGGLYTWMIERGCCIENPFRLIKKPELIHLPVILRQLPISGIQLMLEAARDSTNKRLVARDLFMVSLFYLTGIRTFEATNANMNSIQETGANECWLQIIGRRSKLRRVPINSQLYSALIRYRIEFGLSPTVAENDETPLLLAANSSLKRAHNATVLTAMKRVMKKAASLARDRDLPELALSLESASTHWLRHSCFSHLAAETGNLVLVNTLAGNSSVESVAKYIPIEDQMLLRGSVTLRLPIAP
ncbi:tyrosine-type recombinase/integrase [Pseudomonas abietaniphila]|uniref:tyrosine-type recombinase/integrase n=1 Tax=Pseudomonas abietaniphila TaxID=89065 RepID=UPI00321749A7